MSKTTIYLHGFLGFSDELATIANDTAVNVIGVDWVRFFSLENRRTLVEISQDICNHIRSLGYDSVDIFGYSMGGRLALQCACLDPDLVQGLYLESTHFGYKTEYERKTIYNDFLIRFKQIEFMNINTFLNYWYNQDLFSLTKEKLTVSDYKRKLSFDFEFTRTLMHDLHVSKQPYFVDLINEIGVHINYVTGKADIKYSKYAYTLSKKISNFKYTIIDTADHNVHVSNLSLFKNWFQKGIANKNINK